MEKKQTAVEWLVNHITEDQIFWSFKDQIIKAKSMYEWLEIFEQAKAMHKEEMANTWIKACEDILSAIENDTVASFSSEELFEQYYNKTFGGNNE